MWNCNCDGVIGLLAKDFALGSRIAINRCEMNPSLELIGMLSNPILKTQGRVGSGAEVTG